MTPEQALWLAVVHRVVLDALTTPCKSFPFPEVREAQVWLMRGRARFRLACSLAGLEPDKVQVWAIGMERQGWPSGRVKAARRVVAMERLGRELEAAA